MAHDPLPLPDISAEPPDDPHDAPRAQNAQDAEYEAIHAEIAATERGRWFLSEHVKRNPAADTDRLVGSLARAEAALRGGAAMAMPRAMADDLAQLAAAIGRIGAVIAANAVPAAGGLAASERIQDIAFALRERETDSTLCEALEVALLELGEAFAQHDAAAERAQSAAGAAARSRGEHQRHDHPRGGKPIGRSRCEHGAARVGGGSGRAGTSIAGSIRTWRFRDRSDASGRASRAASGRVGRIAGDRTRRAAGV